MAQLRLSLEIKCQILFGAAVALILIAALSVPWFRMQKLVAQGQRQTARTLAQVRLGNILNSPDGLQRALASVEENQDGLASLRITLIGNKRIREAAEDDPLIAEALKQFTTHPNRHELFRVITDPRQEQRVYRYVRAVRSSDLSPDQVHPAGGPDPLRALLVVNMRPQWARTQLLLNRSYTVIAGLLAGILAIAAFWFITTRLILSPVRVLKETAEKVAEGDLDIRSDINTGDEFEQLSRTFNTMLANLESTQDRLRELNKQLDLRVDELAEANISLFETNRIKSDFLANVSHELRTPLHSIIGFAEVLAETLDRSGDNSKWAQVDEQDEKRERYAHNILTSSRALLQMINELLDLARIETGRIELHVDRISIADLGEGLLGLMRPQADRKEIHLVANLAPDLPVVQTDRGRFQQILFNLLSNAIKFTPRGGRVELGAAKAEMLEEEAHGRSADVQAPDCARVWVRDTGPGVPPEAHDTIFEKFRQLDGSHTKRHGGTGLGLAISHELAQLLGGRIELQSELGHGATFVVIMPLALGQSSRSVTPELTAPPQRS